MADNGNIFDNGGGRHGRINEDRDYDHRLGSDDQSREYARIYDPRAEQEFTNRPEIANQIEAARIEDDYRRRVARNAALSATSSVHFFPSVGKFIIPAENTWAAHAELVKDTSQNLYFNPEKFVYFDEIVAKKFGNPALYDPSHPDYAKFEGLRTNIAVLRNDIIGIYVEDGSFDPGDEKYIPAIASIAAEIGNGLANDKWYKRPFVQSISVDVANVEGVGASEIYKHLIERQTKPSPLDAVRHAFSIPNYGWGLPALADTPFSPSALAAPPPEHEVCFKPSELAQGMATPTVEQQLSTPGQAAERIADLSEKTIATARTMRTPESLAVPTREASVDEARTILRWLRNLQFGDKDMETWLDQGTPPEQMAKAEAVSRLVEIYAEQLRKAAKADPKIAHDLTVTDANDASGAAAMAIAEHALRGLPVDHPKAPMLEEWIDSLPPSADLRYGQPVDRLLETIELGLNRTSKERVSDMSAGERLIEAGARMHAAAYSLRSVDTMQPPAREESIELAREILRKLKNLSFSDKTLKEMIDYANPEDKAAFAQKLEEMVDNYKTLLEQAVLHNPDLLNDPAIKDANDAVGGFAHAVKLMAAKEIPNSMAASQQISADVTQMPHEWKELHDRTVGRLLKTMEGGLEKAVDDLATMQQEQQQQDEEMAQEMAEQAALHSSNSRRRKRRKQQKSGLGGGKQRKQQIDLTADDYVLKQGRFAADAKAARGTHGEYVAPMAGIKAEDLAAIKTLGGNLHNIHKQASEMTDAEKQAAEEKALAARLAEQRNNPRPGRGSRDRM